MAYLQSGAGSLWGGLIAMTLSILPAYRKAKKEELPKPERRWVDYMPHEQIGDGGNCCNFRYSWCKDF